MKKIISLILMMGFLSLSAQNTADRFTTANTDQPQDPRVDQMNFVPNEVIVKFKDEVPLSSGARLRAAGVSAVDKVLKANGVDSLVRLFPDVRGGMLRSAGAPRIVKDPQGRD
ncbi:MAG: hypothetical protein Q8914_12540, partial [Bacteroidota bacterium]|nr:hypothetical protein [Bacteroidota bacterium]